MKNVPNTGSDSSDDSHGVNHLVRFWGSFFISLVLLGIIAGLMLAGLFLLMGYHIF